MAEPRTPTGRRVPLLGHVALLVILIVAVWPLLDLDGPFISDEGSYGVQVRALEAGSWDMGYAFSGADPEGAFVPFFAAEHRAGEVFPYVSHPAWPAALHGAVEVAGEDIGLRLLGVLSLVGLAIVSWLLGDELGGASAAPWAFWLAAASPALANAWILWAHTPSALAAGVLALSAVRGPRSTGWVAAGALASAAGVLLRSEGLLWAGAVALALMLAPANRRSRLAAMAIAGGAGLALLAERAWRAAIVDGSVDAAVTSRAGDSGLTGRVYGIRTALLDGGITSTTAKLLGLLVIVCTLSALAAVLRHRADVAVVLLGVVAVLLTVRLAVESVDPATGLLVAAPLLALAGCWRPARPAHRWLPWALGAYTVAVGLTIYADGGSLQWGGRFFSPIIGPLSAAAGAAIAALLRQPELRARRWRGVAMGTLSAVLLVQAVGAVVVPDRLRQLSEDGLERVDALDVRVLVAGGQQIARLDWQRWPDHCWIAVPVDGDVADIEDVIDVLATAGVQRAGFVGLDRDDIEAAGGTVQVRPGDTRLGIFTIEASGAPLRVAEPYRCDG